ncbi:sarcosine oxidase subunit delta [Alkalilacustris brevis]|uniref:sarcosine oxidase subunit delta n=1 Tax=Alkalilacustris brevis TaxID=2026338 RepID=UPI000E0D5D8B|nr:sarcosine oxidase subunit delta [Alkalilacustris brevis]
MLLLTCPHCHVTAEETEFAPGGQAHLKRPQPEAGDDAFESYMFTRPNPMGVHLERWRHAYGCGKWLIAARCTVTLEVFGTYPAQTAAPPAEIVKKIKKKRPEWEAPA